ncbi:TIGR01777 family oxidoreductase [Demequina sp.]|uniref:TIGR01777 family oxidoreductase n=1 Tax=Demequina sp. TaxID=2050685 RepID=UPI003D13766C
MRVAITGASGLIGTALSASLRADGHEVVALVRREAHAGESRWDPAHGVIDKDALLACDAVVNLAGASIGEKRMTDAYKAVVRQSRTDATSLIATTLADGAWKGVLMQGSAMGFYGDRGEEVLTERSGPGTTFLSEIVLAWEGSAQPAIDAGIRTVFTRTGLVLAPHGGFAERLLPLVRRGLLRRFGNGREFHAWITLEDQVRATRFLMESSNHEGPANIVAPHATRDEKLIGALAAAANKPATFPVPAWAMKLAAGEAAVDLLTSQNAEAGVLSRLGFEWHHGDIHDAARWVMVGAGFAPPATHSA